MFHIPYQLPILCRVQPFRLHRTLTGSPSLTSALIPALLGLAVYMPWSLYIQAGKFNIIPTIISSVAAFTSVGVVSSVFLGSHRAIRVWPSQAQCYQATQSSPPSCPSHLLLRGPGLGTPPSLFPKVHGLQRLPSIFRQFHLIKKSLLLSMKGGRGSMFP